MQRLIEIAFINSLLGFKKTIVKEKISKDENKAKNEEKENNDLIKWGNEGV